MLTVIHVDKDFIQHSCAGVGEPTIDVDVDNHHLQLPFICVTRLQHHSISFSETLVQWNLSVRVSKLVFYVQSTSAVRIIRVISLSEQS